jgi:hypothetical protein
VFCVLHGIWVGHPGTLADEDKDNAGKAFQVWAKPQAQGAVAVLLVSRALSPLPAAPIDLSLRLSNFVDADAVGVAGDESAEVTVRDIWQQKDLGQHSSSSVLRFPSVAAHDSVFLLLTPAA